jgi:hypothetical protein
LALVDGERHEFEVCDGCFGFSKEGRLKWRNSSSGIGTGIEPGTSVRMFLPMLSDKLREMVVERDRFELSLGDAIDVKASIALVLITFLGTVSGTLVESTSLGHWGRIAQVASIAAVIVAGALVTLSVWPRNYLAADIPQKYTAWVKSLEHLLENEPDKEIQLNELIQEGLDDAALARIEVNHRINSTKSNLLSWAFWFILVSLIVDSAALASIGLAKVLF